MGCRNRRGVCTSNLPAAETNGEDGDCAGASLSSRSFTLASISPPANENRGVGANCCSEDCWGVWNLCSGRRYMVGFERLGLEPDAEMKRWGEGVYSECCEWSKVELVGWGLRQGVVAWCQIWGFAFFQFWCCCVRAPYRGWEGWGSLVTSGIFQQAACKLRLSLPHRNFLTTPLNPLDSSIHRRFCRIIPSKSKCICDVHLNIPPFLFDFIPMIVISYII